MTAYVIRRLILGLLVLVIVTIFIFIAMRILPGDPVMLYVARMELSQLEPEQLEAIKHEFGLDKPLYLQYVDWIGGVLRGDLGKSIFLREKVSSIIAERLPITIYLGILALLLSGSVGITLGAVCALRRGKWIDNFFTLLANMGITAPSFWVGILLIYIFAFQLRLLPVHGFVSPFDDIWLSIKQIIMPVFCLSLVSTAILTRQTRSSMLEIIQQDYIRTAWSKGLSERMVVLKHALKNAFIPVITMLGMQVRTIFGGAVVIETVFNIPGIGRMMIEGVQGQDFQVVQGGILITAVAVLLCNIIVDISYGWFDPRVKYS
jgi:peptide/nickel transport system permease protein